MGEFTQNFEVILSKELDEKIRWLVEHYEKEIGAWLIGEITNEKIFIEDFLIPNQDVSSASVDTSRKALVELRKEYKDKCQKIIGHFHSHNTMGTGWSGTDETFMKEFIAPRERAVFIVSSKKDGHRIRLEINKPFQMSVDELEYSVVDEDSEVALELKKEIEKKVIESEPTVTYDENLWKDRSVTKKEINNMITFDNKTNNVIVRNLTLPQFYQIEGVFPIESEFVEGTNSKITIRYFTKDKEQAIQLMKDLREFMKEEFKEDDEIDFTEGNYGDDKRKDAYLNQQYYNQDWGNY